MKLALLGAGRIGSVHARTLASHPEVDTLLVADAEPARAEALARETGARAVSLREAFDARPDAVVVAAPTAAHAELVGACLDRGLPAFCEKPLAPGLAETAALVERIERAGATMQLGFQRRFDPGYAEAKRLVETGALGVLYSVRLATHDPEPPPESYIPLSGGIWRDLFIHDFDALRWLTGEEVAEVYARGCVRRFEVFGRYGDHDTAAALLTLVGGASAVLTGGRHDPLGYDVRAELFGSADSVAVGMDGREPLHPVDPGAPERTAPAHPHFQERFALAYRLELQRFLDVARGRAPNPCTARDALEALRVACAAERSAAERRPVALRELA